MNHKPCLDLTAIPRELLLIFELLKEGNDKAITQEWLTNIDWNKFVDLAMHHRVYPVLYAKLKMFVDNSIPTEVVENIYNQYKQNTFQMLHMSAEMEQVIKLFSAENIRLLFLKGPTLGRDLYGDVSLRTSSDLDFLIPIDQLESAENLLLKQGYEKDDYIKTVLKDWKWRHHHVTYFHPQKRIKLEIHWRLNPGPAKEPSFNELWERKSRSKLTSYPVYTLGKEDLFLFLVSHGSRHGWSRLRWLLDIHQLINKKMDWNKICKLLKTYHHLHAGGQSVILTSQLLSTKIPNEAKLILVNRKSAILAQQAIFYFKRMVNLHTNPVPIDVSLYHKRHLFSLMSIKQKFLFKVSFLYPYPEDAETFPLPKQLHFLYFILRPLLWTWRKTRKNAFS